VGLDRYAALMYADLVQEIKVKPSLSVRGAS
jgi:hypothetical protein